MMLFVIPHFIFALCSWFLLTAVLQIDETGSMTQATLASSVGIVRYGIPLLTAIASARLLTKYLSSKIFKLMPLGLALFAFVGIYSTEPAISGLMLIGLFFLFENFYDPVLTAIIVKESRERSDFLTVNALLNLFRTAARFIGPLIVAAVVATQLKMSIFYGSVVLFSLLYLTLLPMRLEFEEDRGKAGEIKASVDRRSFIVDLISLLKDRVGLSTLLLYLFFYLGVSYVEYLSVYAKSVNVSSILLYSALGAGFLAANVILVIAKGLIPRTPIVLLLSLVITSVSLVVLSFQTSEATCSFLCFFCGFANSVSVNVSSAIFQRYVDKELMSTFVGCLRTCTSIAGVLSMVVALGISSLFGAKGVLVFGAAMILISALVWASFALWRTHEV